ncbi:MAG TPA: L,D-transpeptidase family protein [Terriglobales bacterium]|nr:L,D-transpeptidase family protein [Terriglobales bacterium]
MRVFWKAVWRRQLLLSLIALLLFFGLGSAFPGTQSAPGTNAEKAGGLSSGAQVWIRETVQQGRFAELRWPDFSDYSKHVNKFYELNGYSLWWTRGQEPTPQARQMIVLLQRSDLKGLSPEDYDGARWQDRLARLKPLAHQASEADAAKFDLALTVSAMRYISDLHVGKINPNRISFFIDDESKKYDLAEFLKENVLDAPDVSRALARVEPPYPVYHRTIQALQKYIEFAKEDDGEQLPAVKKAIAPGQPYGGTQRLARWLRLVGDLPAGAKVSADSAVYEGSLVSAVKNFQRRLGRDPSGLIDAQTVADLNVPLSRRVQQMQLMLERLRWLPSSYQKAPVVVNIPEFRLRGYERDFNIGVTMNVVVGKAVGHHSPVFSDTMQYIVFRPYWDVPPSITHAELIPHILRDPDYLAKKDFEVVDSHAKVVATGRVSSEVMDGLRAGRLSVRQRPGPKNSLGLVKFVFPNSYNVYFHDTPATEFFARSRRDFSHGCIRLGAPAELAAWVLRDNPGWNMERIRAAMNGSTTQQVRLAHPIPVLIVYGTVIVLEDGLVHFYDDIYGHDTALEKALAKGYPYPW